MTGLTLQVLEYSSNSENAKDIIARLEE